MKRLFLEVCLIELYIGLLTLGAACRYQFSLVKLTFSVTLHKNFLSHLTNTLKKIAL